MFRHMARAAGLDEVFLIDSCGTHGHHLGQPPHPPSVLEAHRRGYDLAPLRARPLQAGDYDLFDLMLACDAGHRKILERRAPPRPRARIRMLMEFAPDHGVHEIPDPWGGEETDYRHAADLIEDACRGLLAHLRRDLAL
jgi:protein-tyrosine phosphatase